LGILFDNPVVKKGIAVSPDGNFSKLGKFPGNNLKPSGPTGYISIPM
jgi:hypothetical protein